MFIALKLKLLLNAKAQPVQFGKSGKLTEPIEWHWSNILFIVVQFGNIGGKTTLVKLLQLLKVSLQLVIPVISIGKSLNSYKEKQP